MVTGLLKTGQVTSETTKGLGLGIGLVFRVRVSFKVSLFVLYFICRGCLCCCAHSELVTRISNYSYNLKLWLLQSVSFTLWRNHIPNLSVCCDLFSKFLSILQGRIFSQNEILAALCDGRSTFVFSANWQFSSSDSKFLQQSTSLHRH